MGRTGGLNILKPPGMTSHDVVYSIRRLFGEKRVGHGGTLDPAAAGVLPVCLGEATKALQFVADRTKGYTAEIVFGTETDSGDYTGRVVKRAEPGVSVDAATLAGVLESFTGILLQVPPMVSAIKVEGRKLYELAREGVEVDVPAREVVIHSIGLLGTPDTITPGSVARIHVECGKGTYIRSLCRDIGVALGIPAHMGFLVRTRVGAMAIGDALTLEELGDLRERGELGGTLMGINAILGEIPALILPQTLTKRVRNGMPVSADDLGYDTIRPGLQYRMMDGASLLGIYGSEQNDQGIILRSVRGFGVTS